MIEFQKLQSCVRPEFQVIDTSGRKKENTKGDRRLQEGLEYVQSEDSVYELTGADSRIRGDGGSMSEGYTQKRRVVILGTIRSEIARTISELFQPCQPSTCDKRATFTTTSNGRILFKFRERCLRCLTLRYLGG